MNTPLNLTAIALASVALVVGHPLVAQDARSDRESKKPDVQKASPAMMKTSDLLGHTVKTGADAKAQTVGELEDMIVDSRTGAALFGIVSTGGFLGIGETRTAVPCEVLTWRQAGRDGEPVLVLDTTKEKLASAPKFTSEDLDSCLCSDAWCAETKAAFGVLPKFEVVKAADASGQREENGEDGSEHEGKVASSSRPFRMASKLASATLHGTDGEIGSIDDLVIDRHAGKVLYALVDNCAIPWRALTLRDDSLRVNMTKKAFEQAPKLDKDPITRLGNEELCKRIDQFFTVAKK